MANHSRWRLGLLTALVCAVSVHGAQETPKTDATSSIPEQKTEFTPLDLLTGTWRVMENHFNTRGERVATVKGTEAVVWVLDRRAIQRTYTTTTGAGVYRAIGMLTWNDVDKRFSGVWFDNSSTTGPTMVKGEWVPESLTLEFTVESRDKDGAEIRYKVVERFLDAERRVATTYLLQQDQVIKRMVVEYERTIPCPERLRPIYTEKILGINK